MRFMHYFALQNSTTTLTAFELSVNCVHCSYGTAIVSTTMTTEKSPMSSFLPSFYFTSEIVYVLGKAHTPSVPPLRCFPGVAFQTVLVLEWLYNYSNTILYISRHCTLNDLPTRHWNNDPWSDIMVIRVQCPDVYSTVYRGTLWVQRPLEEAQSEQYLVFLSFVKGTCPGGGQWPADVRWSNCASGNWSRGLDLCFPFSVFPYRFRPRPPLFVET